MGLLIDGTIAQPGDLSEYESSINEVAANEGIDLWTKLAVARLEISLAIQKFLLETQVEAPGDLLFSRGWSQGGYGVNQVVVTDALKQWHVLQTLAVVYRDAYSQQLNDRYKNKWKEYGELADSARELYFLIGAGVVNGPLARPEAPALGQVAGKQQATTYYVQASVTNARGEESAPSAMATMTTGEGTALTALLQVVSGANATAWNVYAGLTADSLTRQNATPLGLGELWTMPGALLHDGGRTAAGQQAETFLRKRNVLRRG